MQSDRTDLPHRAISGANWGMLAGFWVELPLLASFLFKTKDHVHWGKLNEWSVRLVLPATMVGVVYGWLKPGFGAPSTPAKKSWATAVRPEISAQNELIR